MRFIKASPAALIFALSLGCAVPLSDSTGAPAETAPGEVGFEMAGPNEAAIIVPVRVNGRGPYDFVLDTGATFTCVDRALAGELDLPEWGGPAGAVVLSPGGDMQLVRIDSLELGEASARDLTACTIDLSRMTPPGVGVRGLVGLNFLKSYRVTIDFGRKSLRLDRP